MVLESTTGETLPQDLAGKVAVVTGASKGIGAAIARQLASRGCSILGTCSRPDSIQLIKDIGESAVAHLDKSKDRPRHVGIVADILSDTCALEIADALEDEVYFPRVTSLSPLEPSRTHRGVDILVLNAAVTGSVAIGDKDSDDKILDLMPFLKGNIQTPTLIVNELTRRKLFNKNSRIVLISSIRATQATPTSAMYSATKAAGESLVRTWSKAFGGKHEAFAFMAGTTANAVRVGLTETTTMRAAAPAAAARYIDAYVPWQSIPRLGQPEDVADVVGFLCSAQARWVTSTVIEASGGGFWGV